MAAGSIVFVPAGVEHYIEPLGDEVVKNLDVFAPAREDYLHLLDWMRGEDENAEKGE
jgi:mannose-6-phosphate isomerase-like protein (cupin superfamily)